MARIKHIAIRTNDPAKTAAFYQQAFDLKQVGKGKNGVYLSDGHINLAILSMRPAVAGETMKLGLDHLGFQVEDVAKTVNQVKQLGGLALAATNTGTAADPSKPQSYFEIKCVGPDGQVIDVANGGWVGTD
jgi:methylmalonyl-CoA/ethylmalonyl-CoA epimerase